MLINSLKLFNFRNLVNGSYHFSPGISCVVGDNGQGKTNLVEAVSLLGMTRSFRTSSLEDLVRWGEKSCSVFATCEISGEQQELGISVEDGHRKTFIEGKESDSVASFVGKLLCVSFSPTDLSLVKGGPQERRRFLDRHAVDLEPGLLRAYLDYQKALRSKQMLLRHDNIDPREIDTWNEILIPAATMIINGRLRLLAALELRLIPVITSLFESPTSVALRLRGAAGALIRERHGEEVTVNEIAMLFVHARDKEIQRHRTYVGPHRDDLVIQLFGKDARAFASQGQTRSIVLALKLALIELLEEHRKDSPIVLLDDVDSELDSKRRAAIFGAIVGQKRQIFITATEFRLPKEVENEVTQVLELRAGALERSERRTPRRDST